MDSTEELKKRLMYVGIDLEAKRTRWDNVAKEVQRMILEARINEVTKFNPLPNSIRIIKLEQELEKLK